MAMQRQQNNLCQAGGMDRARSKSFAPGRYREAQSRGLYSRIPSATQTSGNDRAIGDPTVGKRTNTPNSNTPWQSDLCQPRNGSDHRTGQNLGRNRQPTAAPASRTTSEDVGGGGTVGLWDCRTVGLWDCGTVGL